MKQPMMSFVAHSALALIYAGLNIALATLAAHLGVPLYFDSIFTILVVMLMGPLAGLVTATVTNIVLHITDQVHIAFVMCHYLTVALAWSFRHYCGPTPRFTRFLTMGIVVGIANGLLGSAIALYLFGGIVESHAIDHITAGLLLVGRNIVQAAFGAGMLTNLVDKALAAILVYLVVSARVLHRDPG